MHGTIDEIGPLWDELPDQVQIVADDDLVDDWVYDGEVLHLPRWLMRDMDGGETLEACGIGGMAMEAFGSN